MRTATGVFMALVAVPGAAMAAGSCAARVPPPALLTEPGLKMAVIRFRVDEVTAFPADESHGRPPRIMHLGWDAIPGQLRIVTEWGARWLNLADRSSRDVTFPREMFRAAPVTMSDGSLRIAGLSGSRDVPVLTLDGRPDVVLRGDRYTLPVIADVGGDRASEVLLPQDRGVRIYSAGGVFRRFVASPWYASDRTVVQADADPELEIAFVNTSLARPAIEVHIVNADGSVVADWRRDDGKWLSSVPALGVETLWGLTSTGFVAWDATGHQVDTYPAAGVDYLRDVVGARAGDYVALIASGNGYRCRSLLTIYDRNKQPVYQEAFASRTYAIVGDPTGAAFFVGLDGVVVRYRAPELAARR